MLELLELVLQSERLSASLRSLAELRAASSPRDMSLLELLLEDISSLSDDCPLFELLEDLFMDELSLSACCWAPFLLPAQSSESDWRLLRLTELFPEIERPLVDIPALALAELLPETELFAPCCPLAELLAQA